MHRQVAVEAAQLFDEAFEVDGLLHTDLGLSLLLFVELKKDGSSAAETDRKETERILKLLESDIT